MVDLGAIVHDVFVISEEGLCLYHENFGNSSFEVDGVVISGFLSAIETFSHSVDVGAKKLETKNYKFIYHRFKNLIYIARVSKGIEDSTVSECLQYVAQRVEKLVPSDCVVTGNIEPFKIITSLLHQYFVKNRSVLTLGSFLEISGEIAPIKDPVQAKIYSYVRLKGRLELSKVVKTLRMSEDHALEATKKLVDQGLVKINQPFQRASSMFVPRSASPSSGAPFSMPPQDSRLR